MITHVNDDQDFYIKSSNWSWDVKTQDKQRFFDITARSKFTLCPRGYGAQSFRFYEALQLGSIPVYIHDDNKWQPYSDLLDWNSFAVSIHINDIKSLKDRLMSITDEQVNAMVKAGSNAYNNFFSMENLPFQILTRLRNSSKLSHEV